MRKRAGPPAEISAGGMEISPYERTISPAGLKSSLGRMRYAHIWNVCSMFDVKVSPSGMKYFHMNAMWISPRLARYPACRAHMNSP